MDRVGADFDMAVRAIREKLGGTPVPVQIPIGSEDGFSGMVDLIAQKAIVYMDDLGVSRQVARFLRSCGTRQERRASALWNW